MSIRRYILGRLATRQPVITERYVEGYSNYGIKDGGPNNQFQISINEEIIIGTRNENTGYFRVDIPLDTNITSLYKAFSSDVTGGSNITYLNLSNIGYVGNCTNMQYMLENNNAMTSVTIPKSFGKAKPSTIKGLLRSCTNLTKLDISMLDTSNIGQASGDTNAGAMIYMCSSLTDLVLPSFGKVYFGSIAFQATAVVNLSFAGTIDCVDSYDGLRFQYMTKLSDDSINNLINALADRSSGSSQKLYVSSTVLAKITSEQTALANSKNWTIASK